MKCWQKVNVPRTTSTTSCAPACGTLGHGGEVGFCSHGILYLLHISKAGSTDGESQGRSIVGPEYTTQYPKKRKSSFSGSTSIYELSASRWTQKGEEGGGTSSIVRRPSCVSESTSQRCQARQLVQPRGLEISIYSTGPPSLAVEGAQKTH